MKTEATEVKGTIYVFAKAKSQYNLSVLKPGELPFDYELKSYDYGDENCVRIMEFTVTTVLPEGIDITLKCVENLQEKITAVRDQADKEIKQLNERIRSLALIEYQPGASDE